MKRKLVLVLLAAGLLLMGTGCVSTPNSGCSAGGGSSCNTFTYCGDAGCAAYTGVLNCNCN